MQLRTQHSKSGFELRLLAVSGLSCVSPFLGGLRVEAVGARSYGDGVRVRVEGLGVRG